jgi:hypothetical protein
MSGKRRIAVWSGPRNISTALMRSWGSRPDTYVCDEPLYAHYLLETGIDHPGREEIIASQDPNWRSVAEWLTGDVPEGKSIFYQKHMAHHLLPGVGRDWLSALTNVFLIREPREMLTSLVKVTPAAGIDDTGLPQQWEMFTRLFERAGDVPPVIDARDVLENPRGMLVALCDAVGVPFMEEMLSWEPGPRETDGVWAKHWYGAVEASSGFEPYHAKTGEVPRTHLGVLRECEACYERLYAHRLIA